MRSGSVLCVLICLICILAHAQVNVPFTSSNLPVIVINTSGALIQDDPKITADMGIIFNGTGRNGVTDPFNNYNGKIGIELRGSTSQMFPKKQYGIELRDAAGVDIDASLLNMPAEEDWVLFAPYNDKSLMRDALAYKLGRDMDRYAPRTRFCELVLNGKYQGIYVLMEKIKRDVNRVAINNLNPGEIAGNDLTGGYIIKIDKFTGGSGDGWFSAFLPPNNGKGQPIYFQYEFPEAGEIAAEQRNYIQKFVGQFESALAGDFFEDPAQGYARYIDVNSFIDFLIMQEVTKNVDGYRLSTFLHKQRDSDGGKLVMGPLWDFNLGFGNANYCIEGEPTGFVLDFNKTCPMDDWLIPFWWKRLLQDNTFQEKLAVRWNELRATTLKEDYILTYIDSVTSVLNAESQQRNFTAWPVLGAYVWPNYYVGPSFQSEVSWLKNWLSDRLEWLDQNMPQLITATAELQAEEGYVTAYPNPFTDQFSIEYTLQKAGPVSIRIYDGLGRISKSVNLTHEYSGKFTYTGNIEGSNSFYYYSVQQDARIVGNGKISKQ